MSELIRQKHVWVASAIDNAKLPPFTMVWVFASFTLVWLVAAAALGAVKLSLAGTFGLCGLLLGFYLFQADRKVLARALWLGSANLSVTLVVLCVHPYGDAEYLFAVIAGLPFLVFSWHRQGVLKAAFVLLPALLWIGTGVLAELELPRWEIGAEPASRYFAPISALTVYCLVLLQIVFFVLTSSEYSNKLKSALEYMKRMGAARSTFLRAMSHEMRTPLNQILGYSDLTRAEAAAGRVIDRQELINRMQQVVDASDDMLGMIHSAMALADISEGGVSAQTDRVNLQRVVQDTRNRLRHLSARKNIDVVILSQAEPIASADPELLFAALHQLLDNAIKYTPEHGRIELSWASTRRGRISVVVTDNGPGFPADTQDLAFAPFERLSFANGVVPGGGIGLALARAYVEAMGGEVRIDPYFEGGARLWIDLDSVKEHAELELA